MYVSYEDFDAFAMTSSVSKTHLYPIKCNKGYLPFFLMRPYLYQNVTFLSNNVYILGDHIFYYNGSEFEFDKYMPLKSSYFYSSSYSRLVLAVNPIYKLTDDKFIRIMFDTRYRLIFQIVQISI
jgi:hypothetical protein